jgi:hypothetical protein
MSKIHEEKRETEKEEKKYDHIQFMTMYYEYTLPIATLPSYRTFPVKQKKSYFDQLTKN